MSEHLTEQELKDSEAPWPDSAEELAEYIASLVDRQHDYGTCVYAMSLAATASFNYVAKKLGTTGFQSGIADMDILRRTRRLEWGRILDYSQLLFPQYCTDEFPGWRQIIENNRQKFADEGRKKLGESQVMLSSNVKAHWEWLASLEPAA